MRRDEVLARLKALKPWLEAQGITRIRLFGSHARDEARPDSDIDLVADFARPLSLVQLVGVEQELAAKLGAQVDLATSAGLKPRVRARIDAEAVDA